MSANDSLTPDELGELLKRGEITKEEAIEVMAQRTRNEAMQNLYGPPPEAAAGDGEPGKAPGKPSLKAVIVVLLLIVLFVLLAIGLGQ
ncbi:MAG: hypothetical protein HN742_21280 [Lentisphaerae bacterium]|jgi:hypothetical protein|nr:hypothetical protein [Lentisphaerota bacterium]MBT4818609.1 hypothetical protein [Lentisphaerota bacterium]MBT5605693.1 hypothetical protein [Lentisphaerota bacterium]MBT7060517.1 hypothetical protein [Lentisphaerota bacterium]MBT7844424.1 hypothetical protein [Lentisphaerota bacterium]